MSKVVSVGACVIDEFLFARRLPSAGESVGADSFSTEIGGKAANVAVAAARLGADARLVASLGDDADGEAALRRVMTEGVQVDGCFRIDAPTGRSHITVAVDGGQTVVTWPGAADLLSAERAIAGAQLDAGDVLVLQGEIPWVVSAAVGAAAPVGCKIVVNPSPMEVFVDTDWLGALGRSVDVVIANELEAACLLGEAPWRLGELGRSSDRPAVDALIVTCGGAGAVLTDGDGEQTVPAPTVICVDPTGAGDCFAGAVAAGLAAGRPLREVVPLAVRAASHSVESRYCLPSYPSHTDLGVSPMRPAATGVED